MKFETNLNSVLYHGCDVILKSHLRLSSPTVHEAEVRLPDGEVVPYFFVDMTQLPEAVMYCDNKQGQARKLDVLDIPLSYIRD